MADPLDPPRKLYQLKPREFERVNHMPVSPPPEASVASTTTPSAADTSRIDVRELTRLAAGEGSQLGTNAVRNRETEVHSVLRANFERDQAAGAFHVEATVDKKRRQRIRSYWIILLVVDGIFGGIAFQAGPGQAIPFVSAIGGVGMFTAWWTWHTWFLRTD